MAPMTDETIDRKRWKVIAKGEGVACPSPESLQDSLSKQTEGAVKVLKPHGFEVHGPQTFYTISAPASFSAESIKQMVSVAIGPSYTVNVRPDEE
jgi:hypothetical protein